ncbi:MAG: ARMT1-like domain-containing protein [Thermodesulfovibrionales bacterium]|nr:ARMT1-like domain-containing protein [Thermodesulfovibrionales bacterium]
MKIDYECFPCFIRQSIIACNQAGVDNNLKLQIIKETARLIEQVDMEKSPAHFTTFVHRRIREVIGKDPFETIKQKYNSISMNLYDELKRIVSENSNSLKTAFRLAIAGNIIDFGIFTTIDIQGTINRALSAELMIDRSEELISATEKNKSILYLCDNAGEIVFDMVLIETLIKAGKEITAVVKGSNIINDATIQDAKAVGLTSICRVIDNGSDCVGTILEMTSRDFQKEFDNATLIISKGQGNFETLHDINDKNKEIFFLFQSKCEPLSRLLNAEKGSMFLSSSKKDYIYL